MEEEKTFLARLKWECVPIANYFMTWFSAGNFFYNANKQKKTTKKKQHYLNCH